MVAAALLLPTWIDGQITSCRKLGLPQEGQVVLMVTDGLENAGSDFTRHRSFPWFLSARNKAGCSCSLVPIRMQMPRRG